MKNYTIDGESRFTIDGVMVCTDIEDMTENEARLYLERAISEANGEVVRLEVSQAEGDEGMVDVKYTCRKVKFERIRRKWNDRISIGRRAATRGKYQ